MLGVAVFVGTLGLSSTVGQQVSSEFDVFRATTVMAQVAAAAGGDELPGDASEAESAAEWRRVGETDVDRLRAFDGVVAATWQASAPRVDFPTRGAGRRWNEIGVTCQASLVLLGPGYLTTVGARVEGSPLERADDLGLRHQAVIGSGVASRCGLTTGASQVMIGGRPFAVAGVVTGAERVQGLGDAVLVAVGAMPDQGLAGREWNESVLVQTRVGAAAVVADSAAVALLPTDPGSVAVSHPPDPKSLRQSVDRSLRSLALLASGVALLGGVFAVGNLMMLSVAQRRAEFGMRRAVGATRAQILVQVLAEAGIVGMVAAAAGAVAAAWAVFGVSITQGWRPVLDWPATWVGASAGVAAATLGGLVPAIVAARTQVADSLRR